MELKREILEEISNNYIHGIENKTVRCALVNNSIRDIMRNKEREGKHNRKAFQVGGYYAIRY